MYIGTTSSESSDPDRVDAPGDWRSVAGEHARVARVCTPLEGPVDARGEAGRAGAGASSTRRHHRRQRQRHDAGDEHRAGQREGELAEQRAGEPALEADRRVHRGQRDGHGDDRARPARARRAARPRCGVLPSRMWRSTFSTTTMASSTTRPTESTIASSVSRFSVKPNTCIRKTAPISDTGMATTRHQHRAQRAEEQEDDDDDDEDRLDQRLAHLVDGVVDVLGGVEGDRAASGRSAARS